MSRPGAFALLLVLASCSAPDSPPAAAAAGTSRRLHCLAGPGLQVSSRFDVHFGQTWTSFRGSSGVETFSDFLVDVTVTPAERPAGRGGRDLPPGSCAFEEATLEPSMPRRLRWHGAIHPAVGITWSSRAGVTSQPVVSTPFDGLTREGGGRFWAEVAKGEQPDELAIQDFGFSGYDPAP